MNKKLNRRGQSGAAAHSGNVVEDIFVSRHNTNTIVSGSASPGFIADAVNELLTYYTPQSIVDFINTNCIIRNPPFKNENYL